MNESRDKWLKWAVAVLPVLMMGFAFTLPISISFAQPFAYLAIFVWFWVAIRTRDRSGLSNPFFWSVCIFACVLLLAAVLGPQPVHSLTRSRRLILLALVFVMPSVFWVESSLSSRSVLAPLLAFLAGTTCLGLWDMVRVPMQLQQGIELYDTGNMRDPQLYLVGSCILLALWIYRPILCRNWALVLITIVNVLGIVLHFKRGVWIAFVLSVMMLAGVTKRYRMLGFLIAGIVLLCLIPQTRNRLDLLREEFNERTGGRIVLWTQVAPGLLREYPLGTGLRSLEHEDLLRHTESYIQPGLNHLHNNILQVTVDAGWLGGAVWLFWMVQSLLIQGRLVRRYQRRDPAPLAAAVACCSAFAGLMVNGLVEYNFGNSVIFMVILFLMGITAVLYKHADPKGVDRQAP